MTDIKKYEVFISDLILEDFINLYKDKESLSYDKQYILNKIYNKYYCNWLNTILPNHLDNGFDTRLKHISEVLDHTQFERNSYSCTALFVELNGIKFKYGYIYYKINIQSENNISLDYKYYCSGINLLSQDGEYRQGFNTIKHLSNCKRLYYDLWLDINNFLIKHKFIHKSYIDKFYSGFTQGQIDSDIKGYSLYIDIYIITWIKVHVLNKVHLELVNDNLKFRQNILQESNIKFFKKIVVKYGIKTVLGLYNYIKSFDNQFTQLGQKIIPFYKKDIFNIKSRVWREMHINELLNDILINKVCSGVPYTFPWFILNNVNKTMIDYKNLGYHQHIIKHNKNKSNNQSNNKSFGNFGLSDKLGTLTKYKSHLESKGIEKSLNTIKTVAVIVSEYVSRTFSDHINMVRSPLYKIERGNILQNSYIYKKNILDILYTIYAMNKTCNIIHRDLHLNNTTLSSHHIKTGNDYTINKKNKVRYTLEDNTDIYITSTRKFSCIIDYSRSIVYNSRLIPEIVKDICDFYSNVQDERIKSIQIKNYVEQYPFVFFKIFSALDVQMYCSMMFRKLSSLEEGLVDPNLLTLFKDIVDVSYNYLIDEVFNFISHTNKVEYIKNQKYSTFYILKKVAAMLETRLNPGDKVLDHFSVFNSVKYSTKSFNTLPPFFKSIYLKKGGIVKEVPDNKKKENVIKYFDLLKRSKIDLV